MTRSRVGWPMIVFYAIVLAIAALLIGGFGIPVGVGLILGIVAGLAVTLFAIARQGRSTGGAWFATHGSGSMSGSIQAQQAEIFRDHDRLQFADEGELERVVPAGGSATVNGVTLEWVALEIRSSGAVAHLAALVRSPASASLGFARVTVEDDVATPYFAAMEIAGGGIRRVRLAVRIAPKPPAAATTLRLHVDEFVNPFPNAAEPTTRGPWDLSLDLRVGPA